MDIFNLLLQNAPENKKQKYIAMQNLFHRLSQPTKATEFFSLIFKWFKEEYYFHTLKIEILNESNDERIVIDHKGSEFDPNNPKTFIYDIQVCEHLILKLSLCTDTLDHAQLVSNQKDDLDLFFNIFTPIFKMFYFQQQLENNTTIDNVTGLPNRNYLLQHLNQLIPFAQRENKKIGFIMIGVDHFKAVIDEFDYDIGDKVLINLANTIKKNIRASDIAIRLNADEFFVTLPSISNTEDVVFVAQKLVEAFKDCEVNVNAYTNQTLKKTICAGTTVYPDDSTSIDQLFKYADIALYEARNKGRSVALAYSQEETSTIDLF